MIWRNSFFNLLGLGIPLLLSIATMGWLSRILSVEEFGIFLISFSVLGYASIFDMGLTRAVIRFISINNSDFEKDRLVMGTSTIAVFVFSIFIGLVLYLSCLTIIDFLKVTESSLLEVEKTFKILALIIAPTLISMVWFSFLEGRQEFLKLNIYKTISGIIIALGPLLGGLVDSTLSGVMIGFLYARLLSCLIAFLPNYFVFKFKLFCFKIETLIEMIKFGGWITLSNFISSIMVYTDKFILSNILGANQVAVYAAPSEVVSKMGIVPGAIARVIFPLFSASNKDSKENSKKVYVGMIVIMFVLIAPIFIFSELLLGFWLGENYALEGSTLLRILLVGFFFNSLAQIPFSRIQAFGKSKLTAYIHIFEVLPYLIILLFFVNSFGLIGAAISWSLRVIIDYLILEYFSKKLEFDVI